MTGSYQEQDQQAHAVRAEIANERDLLLQGVPPLTVAKKLWELAQDNRAGYDLADILQRFNKDVDGARWSQAIADTIHLAEAMNKNRSDRERLINAMSVGFPGR